ncbi:hypothetical protein L9F63_012648, partial [Diploptera punctata]
MPDNSYHDYPTYPLSATANGNSGKSVHQNNNATTTEKHVLFFPSDTAQPGKVSQQQQWTSQQTV